MKGVRLLYFLILFCSQPFFAFSYSVFRENGKVGLKNEAGKVVIPAQYEEIGWSNGDFSLISNVTGYKVGRKWGLINLDNHKVTKAHYEEIIPGQSDLIIVKRKAPNSLHLFYGCITPSGKEIIPFIYDGISINAMRAIVYTKIGNEFKYGLIDLANKTLIPQQYQDVKPLGTLRFAVKNFEGKTAIFTENGKQVTPFDIDSIGDFNQGYAVLYKGKHKGLIDRNGEQKLEAKYREIHWTGDGQLRAREADEWLFLDGANKMMRSLRGDSVSAIAKDLLKIQTSGQTYLVRHDQQLAFKETFSKVGTFNAGLAAFSVDALHGVLRADGTIVLPAQYYQVRVTDSFILASTSGKSGWILFDRNGARKGSRSYEQMHLTPTKNLAVFNKGFWGVVGPDGNELLACVYDSLIKMSDDHAIVKFRGSYGVIDYKEEWLVSPKPNRIEIIAPDRILEKSGTSTNLRSFNGSMIYFTDNRVQPVKDGLLEFHADGRIWKIDFHGVIVNREEPATASEKVYEESEGYRAIKRNGRYGFIDSRGRLRIANRYEDVRPFKEGFAAVKILGKWGFINTSDNLAVQPVYEEVFPFKHGRALVKQKGLFGLIDNNGKLILPVRYQRIDVLKSGNILVQQNNTHGLVDASGRMLIQPRFDSIEDTGHNFAIVGRGGKYGVINYQGISTIPLIYDHISYNPYHDHFLAMRKSSWIDVKL